MPTQIVKLTPELEGFVKHQVTQEPRLETLRGKIQLGLDDINEGRYTAISSEKEHESYFAKLQQAAEQRVDK